MDLSPQLEPNAAGLAYAPRSRTDAEHAAWPWRGRAQVERAAASARVARSRRIAALRGVVGLAVAASLFALGHALGAAIAASLAMATTLLALAAPNAASAGMQRGLSQLGQWLGFIGTCAVMLPIFLLFFVPFGMVARGGANDRLQRRFDPHATTYWRRRDAALGGERHTTPF